MDISDGCSNYGVLYVENPVSFDMLYKEYYEKKIIDLFKTDP